MNKQIQLMATIIPFTKKISKISSVSVANLIRGDHHDLTFDYLFAFGCSKSELYNN